MKYLVLLTSIFLLIINSSCKQKGSETSNLIIDKNDSTIVNEDKQEVSVMVLRYGDFNKEIISNGKLIALRKADLKFRSPENVVAVYVKNGDRVEKGRVIAKLDDFTLSNALKQSSDQFEKTKIDIQDVLLSQGYDINDTANIPERIMKTARIRSGYDHAKANMEMAEYNLRASVLKAPFSGIIADLSLKENNLSNQSEKFCLYSTQYY